MPDQHVGKAVRRTVLHLVEKPGVPAPPTNPRSIFRTHIPQGFTTRLSRSGDLVLRALEVHVPAAQRSSKSPSAPRAEPRSVKGHPAAPDLRSASVSGEAIIAAAGSNAPQHYDRELAAITRERAAARYRLRRAGRNQSSPEAAGPADDSGRPAKS